MKKLLLGTSALVAAGLFSNGAFAQTATTDSPIKMSLGGQYYAGAAAMIQQDDQPGEVGFKRQPTSMQDYFLIRFMGSTTFSNGITAGVFTRLNAFSAPFGTANTVTGQSSSNNTWIKDSYVYLKNAATWGEFRLGDDSDVRRNDAVGNNAGVSGDGNLGANSGALQFLNLPTYVQTTTNLDGRGTKAVYYSPVIAGFHLAASYTPDKGGGHTNGPGNIGDNSGLTDGGVNGLTASYLNGNTAYNYWSIAGGWNGTVGPVKIAYTLGYSTGSRKNGYSGTLGKIALGSNVPQPDTSLSPTNNADPHIYNTGAQLNYGPFELGVDYEQSVGMPGGEQGGANANSVISSFSNQIINKQVDVNLSYTVGAIRFGGEWAHGSFEGMTGDTTDVKRAADLDVFQVGGTYTVGPGVNLIGMVQEALYSANGAYVPLAGGVQNVFAKSSNSTALIFETSLRF
jgi:outer membrane protein OmpU